MNLKDEKKYIAQYENLDDKEKIKRLEYLASIYMAWLDVKNYKYGWKLDATFYWPEHEKEMNKGG